MNPGQAREASDLQQRARQNLAAAQARSSVPVWCVTRTEAPAPIVRLGVRTVCDGKITIYCDHTERHGIGTALQIGRDSSRAVADEVSVAFDT